MRVHARSTTAVVGVLVAAGLVLSTAACSSRALGVAASGAAARSSGAGTTTSQATSSAPTTTVATTTAPTTSASDTASASPDGELGSDARGRRLTLADFFNPSSDWQEKRYNIADQKDVPGIAAVIGDCYSTSELELRLANNFQQLQFSVAQSNDSRSSDQNLSVEVLANNAQVDIRSVPFNQIQAFTIPVSGVNALKIRMSLDRSNHNCGGSVIGVVTDATLS